MGACRCVWVIASCSLGTPLILGMILQIRRTNSKASANGINIEQSPMPGLQIGDTTGFHFCSQPPLGQLEMPRKIIKIYDFFVFTHTLSMVRRCFFIEKRGCSLD